MNVNERAFGYVVLFLGITLLLCVGGFIALAILQNPVPDELKMIATGAITGLGSLLARTPNQPPPDTNEDEAVV